MVDRIRPQHPFYVERFGPIQWSDQEPDSRPQAQFWIAVNKRQNNILEVLQGPIDFKKPEERDKFLARTKELWEKYPYDHQLRDRGDYDIVILTGHVEIDGSPDVNELRYYLPTIQNWDEVKFEVFEPEQILDKPE